MDGNVVFSGNLRFLGIPDLLQLIATTNSNGILELTNPHAQEPASVTFLRGNPTHATYSSLRGLEALYALFGWTTGQSEIHSGIHVNEKFFFSSEEKPDAGKRVETPFLISRGNATIVEDMKNHPFATMAVRRHRLERMKGKESSK